jgi:hypothetical protein
MTFLAAWILANFFALYLYLGLPRHFKRFFLFVPLRKSKPPSPYLP